MVHELKEKDIEEYRKKIVERDKNKDEDKDIAGERRMVVERVKIEEKGQGERSKFERKEESEKSKEVGIGFQMEDDDDQSDQRVPSPANVFTFDQEDIQTSKLLSFEKVSNV